MKFISLIILCCIGASSWEQTALIGNSNGQWRILKNNSEVLLPRTIHEVGNFDSKNLTFFGQNGNYGIMNDKGAVVHEPEFKSIKQLGSGVYYCLGKVENYIIDFSTTIKPTVVCLDVKYIQPNWYIIETKERRYLFNSVGKKEYYLNEGDQVISKEFNYVYLVKSNADRILINPNGELIELGESVPVFKKNYLLIRAASVKKVVYSDHEINLPVNSSNIIISENEIHYTVDGRTTLINPLDGRILFSAPFDEILLSEPGVYFVKKGWKTGVIKSDGSIICPPIYNFIINSKRYYSVNNDKGNGIVSKEGKVLVPCEYESVRMVQDFFITESPLRFQGLVSQKNNKVLLNCTYDRILIDGNKIRARFNDKMRMLEIDSSHNIISDVTLDNVLSLGPMGSGNKLAQIDNRLFSLGWFTEETAKFNEQGYNIGSITKWGLKGANDSILLQPRFSQPTYIPLATFSLMRGPKMKYSYGGVTELETNTVSFALLSSGRIVQNEPIICVDTMDCFSRYYSRFFGVSGFGIIRSDDKIVFADYIDGEDDEMVRFARFQEHDILPAKEMEPNAIRFPNLNLNDDPSNSIRYQINRKNYQFVKLENAKWNYFDSVGDELFSTPFEFAEPFFRKTAIVQKGGKWGVVRMDSVLIPCNYASVKRVSEFSDTVFIVCSVPNGIRYLDTLAHEMKKGITSFKSETGEIAQIRIGRGQKIIDKNYRVLSGEKNNQKLIGTNMFFTHDKKEFNLYSAAGHHEAAISVKPEEIFLEKYIVAKVKGRFGLIDFYGDTVVPFNYKSMSVMGSYIFAKDGFQNTLFDHNMKVLRECKTADILVDSASGNYAVLLNGKCKVYSAKDHSAIGKFSDFVPNYFVRDYLIQTKGTTRIKKITGEDIELPFEVVTIEFMDNHGYLMEDKNRVFHYYTSNWEEVKIAGDLKRARYVGNGYFTGTTKKGTLLYGNEKEIWFDAGTRVIDKFESGFLLIEEPLCIYFIDSIGQLAFNRKFDEATPFSGNYATVSELEGWSIIDISGQLKSFPSYGKIKPLGANVFSTQAQAKYGLFNSHGEEILPVAFQKINFLPGKIIQGIKDGELFYFDYAGKPLSL